MSIMKKSTLNKITGSKVINKTTGLINNSRVRSRVHNVRWYNTLDFRIIYYDFCLQLTN